MSDRNLSTTFGNWKDRLTYIIAEAQLLVLGVAISVGILLLLVRPSVPGVPPIAVGIAVALMLLGPPLFGLFAVGAEKLRNRHRETVYHINGVTDTREKYYVAPELWDQKTVDGPSPYVANDGDAYEVREFEHFEDMDELRVTGCYMSQMADSKLVTSKAMLEDVHGDLVDAFLQLNRLRGRISKMGLEIQSDVINQEAEADERGLMNPKTTVKDRFDAAKSDVEDKAREDIEDIDGYEDEYILEHGEHAPRPRPNRLYDTVDGIDSPARADGGSDE
ncbi:hypothetical protein [Natrinema sp. SYSU A 869]|uniref:hypothetical protein n=1 Tax=Natrinema sp. SYSU A 869 TaxID=2871694 RepID=UPI001CA3D784|nr:hypothetical protein [Natrinema sp. SYSU A 869]